ncbi:MAG: hypothetical protein ACLFPS_05770 [Clostridia bacterium]
MAYSRDLNKSNETEDERISRINSAGLINSTLENLWKDVYNAMSKGDYFLWNVKLDAIWSLLGGDCKDNDPDDKYITELNLQIYKKGSLKSKTGQGFSKESNPNNAMQYLLLVKKNLFLRRLQNRQGKGTAYEDTDEFDWE